MSSQWCWVALLGDEGGGRQAKVERFVFFLLHIPFFATSNYYYYYYSKLVAVEVKLDERFIGRLIERFPRFFTGRKRRRRRRPSTRPRPPRFLVPVFFPVPPPAVRYMFIWGARSSLRSWSFHMRSIFVIFASGLLPNYPFTWPP